MVLGMSIHLHTTTRLLLDRYSWNFIRLREASFYPKEREEIEVLMKLDQKLQTFYNRCHVHLLFLWLLVLLWQPCHQVIIVYMAVKATMATWSPNLPLFTGCYSNVKAPAGLCSACISNPADRLQNKILLLKRRNEMSTLLAPACNHSNQ